jgi:hypothetical protein
MRAFSAKGEVTGSFGDLKGAGDHRTLRITVPRFSVHFHYHIYGCRTACDLLLLDTPNDFYSYPLYMTKMGNRMEWSSGFVC